MGKTVEAQVSGGNIVLIYWSLYTTYVLKSGKFVRHYYGHTKDLVNRLKRHNQGKVRSTKAFLPWKVVYTEEFQTKSEAYQREMFFKSIEGYQFLKSKGII